ncbi:unnamed protein product [Aureobasidium uvarum]|uniref:Uncharacterized protein n=1 Tax=Aureobasidium uvarum TaxID=2773716 RepID=A0A9N8KMD0_9PEZI|nr:unnamed protein product [Aureobasidium uvarum]
MSQLDYEDHVEDNPWRPVRIVLFILWAIHFFVCVFTTVGVFAQASTASLDFHTAMSIISILLIDVLYIRQMHLYAIGKLEPLNAAHMHSIQCVMVAWLMMEIFTISLHEMFGLFIFLYSAVFASTFLILLSVSLGVLTTSLRKNRGIQLPVLNIKI